MWCLHKSSVFMWMTGLWLRTASWILPELQPIARMGYYDYTVVRDVFEMRIPDASGEALAGLEGKS
jgi:hypothetical protein